MRQVKKADVLDTGIGQRAKDGGFKKQPDASSVDRTKATMSGASGAYGAAKLPGPGKHNTEVGIASASDITRLGFKDMIIEAFGVWSDLFPRLGLVVVLALGLETLAYFSVSGEFMLLAVQQPFSAQVIGKTALFLFLTSWAYLMLETIFAKLIIDRFHGKELSGPEMFGWFLNNFTTLMVLSVSIALITVIGTLLFVLPGIFATIILFLAIPICVDKNCSVSEAIRDSIELSKGSRWLIFRYVVSIAIIIAVMFFIAGLPFSFLKAASPIFAEAWTAVSDILSATMRFFVTASFAALFYVRLVEEYRGGFGRQIEQVFE